MGSNGGGKEQGAFVEGSLTIDSVINFFSDPLLVQAMASAHSSTAPSGTVGSNLRSLAYSFSRWNM